MQYGNDFRLTGITIRKDVECEMETESKQGVIKA